MISRLKSWWRLRQHYAEIRRIEKDIEKKLAARRILRPHRRQSALKGWATRRAH